MVEHLKNALREWLGPPPGSPTESTYTYDVQLLEYTYDDLSAATRGFKADALLGSGSAGYVYRGMLRGGTDVAVKVVHNANDLGGLQEELRVLGRFRHPNLVTLIGWGQHQDNSYLVYELLQGGDVGKKLWQSKTGQSGFTWRQRLSIARDAACGLSFMVNSQPKAFHRDIKPANILVDAYGVGKMADFGLASIGAQRDSYNADGTKPLERSTSYVDVDRISGSPGYVCPTYAETGRVCEQSEVYSFGVVLLEMLVNELPGSKAPGGGFDFPLFSRLQPSHPGARDRVRAALDRSAGWVLAPATELSDLGLQCVGAAASRPLFDSIVAFFRRLCPDGASGVVVSTLRLGTSLPSKVGAVQRMLSAPATPCRSNTPPLHAAAVAGGQQRGKAIAVQVPAQPAAVLAMQRKDQNAETSGRDTRRAASNPAYRLRPVGGAGVSVAHPAPGVRALPEVRAVAVAVDVVACDGKEAVDAASDRSTIATARRPPRPPRAPPGSSEESLFSFLGLGGFGAPACCSVARGKADTIDAAKSERSENCDTERTEA